MGRVAQRGWPSPAGRDIVLANRVEVLPIANGNANRATVPQRPRSALAEAIKPPPAERRGRVYYRCRRGPVAELPHAPIRSLALNLQPVNSRHRSPTAIGSLILDGDRLPRHSQQQGRCRRGIGSTVPLAD